MNTKRKKATAYYKGGHFVYCKVGQKHFAVDTHWETYLKLRREVPPEVELFSSLKLLRHKLLNQQRILI